MKEDMALLMRHYFKDQIKKEGWKFTFCLNATEAKSCLSEKNKMITHLITDIAMPGEDGISLASFVSRTYPHIRIILASAYDACQFKEKISLIPIQSFVSKPFSLQALKNVILDKQKEPPTYCYP